jgi:enamine deaminase RidA (YjgF/YER057c/UK114 family)
VFVTATPAQARPAAEQAATLLAEVAEVLKREGAWPVQERFFGTEPAVRAAAEAHATAYGDLADGVPPELLTVPEGPNGALSAVQVHAIQTDEQPAVLADNDRPCGRMLNLGNVAYVVLSGLTAPEAGSNTDQARTLFERASHLLRRVGGSMESVIRTWLWLGDILAWYDAFNTVRNQFFKEAGLIDGSGRTRLPASTGIGVGPAGDAVCALDVVALIGPKASLSYYHAAGMQESAYEYGSAFSRVAKAATPGGTSVYVSGTAAIDEAGLTRHVGDAAAQIDMTLANVRAALKDMECSDADVVHAIAYSKTPEIQALFDREYAPALGWPCVSVLSDVCRDDLLFELEATACPAARTA